MKRASLCLVLVSALLVPASLALAASLPQPGVSTVVVPTSIAGIRINMPEASAKAAWGSGRGKCVDFAYGGRCEYGSATGKSGSATIGFQKGKVSSVEVITGTNGETQLTTAAAALTKMRTPGGIGIGSKLSALKKAFPAGKLQGKPSDEVFYLRIDGSGKNSMVFGLLGASKKVFQIFLSNGTEV